MAAQLRRRARHVYTSTLWQAQLLLNPGDEWAYQFDVLPRTGSTNAFIATAGGSFQFTVDGGTLQDGDQLAFEMFETSTNEAPICSGTVTSGSALTRACDVPGAWQQLHGTIRFRMVTGSVQVDRVTLQAIVSGPSFSSYDVYTSSFVPGPGPRLTVALVGNTAAQIAWLTNFTDHALEYATNVPATDWYTVTNQIATVGDRFSITLEAGFRIVLFR